MQKQFIFPAILSLLILLSSCIGDDIIMDRVDEQIRIMNTIDTLGFGEEYQFEAAFFNNVGAETPTSVEWSSSDETIITIDNTGLAKAIESGAANIHATVNLTDKTVRDTISIVVGENTVIATASRSGKVETTSSYKLTGSFTMEELNGLVRLAFTEDYEASTALPGLYAYLSNNPNSINGAFEIGAVEVFEGAHSYDLEVDINEYNYVLYWCKPFRVKVGEGEIE